MPTSARLISAILFAAIGWFAADLVKPLLAEGTSVGRFSPISAILGFMVGWWFTGKRLADEGAGSLGIGITSSFLLAFWVILVFSGYEMLKISMRSNRYDGPMEALQGMFGIAVDYIWLAATPEVIATLALGGLFSGWITAKIAQRWS